MKLYFLSVFIIKGHTEYMSDIFLCLHDFVVRLDISSKLLNPLHWTFCGERHMARYKKKKTKRERKVHFDIKQKQNIHNVNSSK